MEPALLIVMGIALIVIVALKDFRRNLGTISSLSVLLVIVLAFATGFLLYMLLPDLTLALAIALGAVISPPFIPAEQIGASGVIAAVAAGLYTRHNAPRIIDAQARINERLNWRTVQFIMEHGVFLIMGLELHYLIHEIDPRLLSVAVITLAAAQSLPESSPYREQLVLIAFTVAITTLVVQGGSAQGLLSEGDGATDAGGCASADPDLTVGVCADRRRLR